MTDERPVLLAPEADASKRRINGWELALWIVGVALLVISGVLSYIFAQLIFAQTPTGQSGTGFIAFAQTSSLYTPGMVTGGIVCIALALFSRALNANARQRDALRPTQVPAAVVPPAAPAPEPSTASVAPQRPAARAETAFTDYSAFMRPPDEAADFKR